jgi:MFS family permease
MVIGVWGASAALGAALGPSAGAVLLDLLSWRWVFLVNVPIGVLILILVPRYVAESLDPDAEGDFDLVGVPAGTLGVALLLVAVVQGADWGYGSMTTASVAFGGVVLLVVLVVRSATHPSPLLDLGLFQLRSFWSASVGQLFFTTAFIAIVLFNTLLLQQWWGWSPLAAGFGVVAGPALAAVIGGPVGSIADRFGHRRLLVIGSLAAAGNPTWLWLRSEAEPDYLVTVLPAQFLLGIGVACSFATFASLGLRDVPQARFATASATLRTTSSLGFAIGVAIAVAIYSAAAYLGPVVAYRRIWAFAALTLFAGATFCRFACPPGSFTAAPLED